MTESLFGPIVSTWDIEQATLTALKKWVPEYLAEIERKRGLQARTIPRPPAYFGGVDEESWKQADTPQVIVTVKPVGAPELRGQGGYAQGYTLTVGCVWVGVGSTLAERPEDEARAVASYLGAASMLLVQKPALGGLAERLRMTVPPTVSAPNPDRKDIALSVTQFEVWVATIIQEGAGPAVEKPEGAEFNGPEEPWGPEPEVKEAIETITAKTVSEEV